MTRRWLTLRATVAFLAVACLIAIAPPAGAQSLQEERIAAAFVLALGRVPTGAETAEWIKEGPLPVATLFGRHRSALAADDAAWARVSAKAMHDAFGADVAAAASGAAADYSSQVRKHVEWLSGHADEYEQVVQRAYRAVLGRDAYSVEIEYWKGQPVTSYVMLAGSVENWAVRNQPGLMATAGVPAISVTSRLLATARLSPEVAAEARAVAALPPTGGSTAAASLGRHVVAPGGTAIVSVGGVHFVAAGGPLL
jgi:hypothetical protein